MASGDVKISMTAATIRSQSSGPISSNGDPQHTLLGTGSGISLLTVTVDQFASDSTVSIVPYVLEAGKTYDVTITEH